MWCNSFSMYTPLAVLFILNPASVDLEFFWKTDKQRLIPTVIFCLQKNALCPPTYT